MKKTRLAAAGAALALGIGAVLGGALPATAANSYYNAADLEQEGDSYPNTWFTGNPLPEVAPADSEDGLVLTGRTQLLYGNVQTGADLRALVDSAEVAADGDWHFQIPVFLDGEAGEGFSTFRPADPNVVSTEVDWISTGNVGTVPRNTRVDFDDIVAAFDGGDAPTILAHGILVLEGNTTTVASISWGGDTSFFTAEPPVVPEDPETPGTPAPPAPPATPVDDNASFTG